MNMQHAVHSFVTDGAVEVARYSEVFLAETKFLQRG